jgi:hypothetical protein
MGHRLAGDQDMALISQGFQRCDRTHKGISAKVYKGWSNHKLTGSSHGHFRAFSSCRNGIFQCRITRTCFASILHAQGAFRCFLLSWPQGIAQTYVANGQKLALTIPA